MPDPSDQLIKLGSATQSIREAPQDVTKYRAVIEPWLSALFQSDHLCLLVGNGLPIAIAVEAGIAPPMMPHPVFDPGLAPSITQAATQAAAKSGRGAPNFEDDLRAALELHAGLTILNDARAPALKTEIATALQSLVGSISTFESALIAALASDAHVEARVHRRLAEFLLSMANRPPSRERLHVFTLNYDRLIEYACDVLGIRTLDRFIGALSPRFRASRLDVDLHYNPPGIRGEPRYLEGVVRYTKLHGSLDWRLDRSAPTRVPIAFGTPAPQTAPDLFETLLVFPNAAKDIETAYFPYAELLRDFATAACRPNTTLVTYGYSFGDDHLNRVVRDMLTLPSTHLLAIAYDDASERISRFRQGVPADSQISILLGADFGGLGPLCEHYLPRPDLDRILTIQAQASDRRPEPIALPAAVSDGDDGADEDE